MTIQGSRLRTNEFRPNRIFVYADRLEEHNPGLIKRKIQKLRYEQIAQIGIDRGPIFATLRIESTGGAVMVVKGLAKDEANKAEVIIRERIQQSSQMNQNQPVVVNGPTSISVADELQKLAALRDSGVVTEEEFQQQKNRLLSN